MTRTTAADAVIPAGWPGRPGGPVRRFCAIARARRISLNPGLRARFAGSRSPGSAVTIAGWLSDHGKDAAAMVSVALSMQGLVTYLQGLYGPLFLGTVGIVAIFFLFTREITRIVQFPMLAVAIGPCLTRLYRSESSRRYAIP